MNSLKHLKQLGIDSAIVIQKMKKGKNNSRRMIIDDT